MYTKLRLWSSIIMLIALVANIIAMVINKGIVYDRLHAISLIFLIISAVLWIAGIVLETAEDMKRYSTALKKGFIYKKGYLERTTGYELKGRSLKVYFFERFRPDELEGYIIPPVWIKPFEFCNKMNLKFDAKNVFIKTKKGNLVNIVGSAYEDNAEENIK